MRHALVEQLFPSRSNAEENLISFAEQALYLSHLPVTLAISPSRSTVSSFTEGLARAILIRYSLAYLYTEHLIFKCLLPHYNTQIMVLRGDEKMRR